MFILWLERSNILFSTQWTCRNLSLAIFQFNFEVSRSSRKKMNSISWWLVSCYLLPTNLSPYSLLFNFIECGIICKIFSFHSTTSSAPDDENLRTQNFENVRTDKKIASVKNRWNSLVIIHIQSWKFKNNFLLGINSSTPTRQRCFSRQQRSWE